MEIRVVRLLLAVLIIPAFTYSQEPAFLNVAAGTIPDSLKKAANAVYRLTKLY